MATTANMATFSGIGPGQRPRVLLVEDDAQFLDFLRLGFEYEGCEVRSAATGPEAVIAVAHHVPDVIVLERHLPGVSGLELLRLLRADANDAVTIMLAANDSADERIAGLEAGADDVMSKPVAFKELMARVRAGLRRRRATAGEALFAFEDVTLDRQTHIVQRRGRTIELTPREFELLALFLRHPRQVLTRDVILAYVWGDDYRGESNVLDVYMHALRVKLGDQPPRLLRTVRGMGYVLRGRDLRALRHDTRADVTGCDDSAHIGVTRRGGQQPQDDLRVRTYADRVISLAVAGQRGGAQW